jgi:hypothetical protein
MRPTHPVDLINAIKRQRGESEGPPHDQLIANRNIFDPDLEDSEQPALSVPPVVRAEPGKPLLMPTSPLPDAGTELSAQNEGVSLSDGAGFYQGHELRLTPVERRQLRTLLAKVVLRQLKAERARVATTIRQA